MQVLKFKSYPHFSQDVVLDGVEYRMVFHWSAVQGCFNLTVQDPEDGEIIVAGIRVCLGVGLLHQYRHLALPQGELMVIRPDGGLTEPARTDLVTGACQLVYLSEDEIAAAEAA